MKKVLSFGELLFRISPELDRQWIRDSKTAIYLGGSELNVATALAKWDMSSAYCTALPDNYLSKEVVAHLTEKGIDTSPVRFSGSRIGTYYLPQGQDLQHKGVIYDRAHSSFSELKPGTINWEEVLSDCSWLHISSISPALSEQTALVCLEALKAAFALQMTTSIDLNFRGKLWQFGKRPLEMMSLLLPYCDVVMGNMWSAEQLLDIPCDIHESSGKSNEQLIASAEKSMRIMKVQYPSIQTLAYTFRLSERYFGVLLDSDGMVTISKEFSLHNVKDQVGSGDCFMAGLIYGLNHFQSPQEVVDFASAAAFGKMSEFGDASDQTVQEVLKNMNNS